MGSGGFVTKGQQQEREGLQDSSEDGVEDGNVRQGEMRKTSEKVYGCSEGEQKLLV